MPSIYTRPTLDTRLESCGRLALRGRLILCTVALTALIPAAASAQQPCSAEEHRHFDFWEGRWMVRAATGVLAGHNTLSLVLGECVLQEHYTTPSGYEGQSLNMFDQTRGVWHQTWMDNQGTLLRLEGGYESGRMVMQGETVDTTGVVTLNRITWSRVDDRRDRVRHLWELSTDGGTVWSTFFDGTYIRLETNADWDFGPTSQSWTTAS
jgi:hypothetical protein